MGLVSAAKRTPSEDRCFLGVLEFSRETESIGYRDRKKIVVVVQSLSCVWLFWDPPLSMGILQGRMLEWVAISFFRGSSQTRDQTCISCTGRQILYHWATRKALKKIEITQREINLLQDIGSHDENPMICHLQAEETVVSIPVQITRSGNQGRWWSKSQSKYTRPTSQLHHQAETSNPSLPHTFALFGSSTDRMMPTHMGKAICFTYSTSSNANVIQKHPHRHIQK